MKKYVEYEIESVRPRDQKDLERSCAKKTVKHAD